MPGNIGNFPDSLLVGDDGDFAPMYAGPLQVFADKQHTVNWPPYAGGILVIGGVILLAGSGRKS